MPYFLSRTPMFVLNGVMNDDMKYFKCDTASINVAQGHVSVVTKYDLFTACTVMCNSNTLLPIRAVPHLGFSVFGRIRTE